MTDLCNQSASNPFRCPTKWELFEVLKALLPRGRAWQTHDDVEEHFRFPLENAVAGEGQIGAAILGLDASERRLTVMQQYWAAFAETLEYFHQRACALINEFFCATARETLDLWHADYGFPDACEPYDRLCDKVAAQGGATCAYLTEISERRGWKIECVDCSDPGDAVAGCMYAGGEPLCGCDHNLIYIRVISRESPAFSGDYKPMQSGIMEAGCHDPCGPDAASLFCLIERFKPAHVRAIYEVI